MRVNEEGRVTIPKDMLDAAGAGPGSEVAVSLNGSDIVITRVAGAVVRGGDRREQMRAAGVHARASMSAESRQMSAGQITRFLRPDDDVLRGGGRWPDARDAAGDRSDLRA